MDASPPHIYAASDLPAEIKAGLPALAVSGGTYSDNPAHRMLIVNGQVVMEGQAAAANVRLERIEPKAAVFSSNGVSWRVTY